MERHTVEASSEDAADVMEVVYRFDEAIRRKDIDAAIACFVPEAISFGTGIHETTFGVEIGRASCRERVYVLV